MTPAFLSVARCAEGTTTSPLRRALLDTVSDTGAAEESGSGSKVDIARPVRDISLQTIVEIRGDVDRVSTEAGEEIVRLSPRRAFLFGEGEADAVVDRLRAAGVLAYDMTGAYAGMAIADERVVRRLTDLDLDAIPTAGPFAHVSALFRRGADGWIHVYVHQELGHYVAEAVLDAIAGLEETAWH